MDEALEADAARRQAIADFERLRAEQKGMGKRISAATADERQELLGRAKSLAADVKAADAKAQEAAAEFTRIAWAIDNLLAPGVPLGGEDDFTVLAETGRPRDFDAEGFTPQDHIQIGRRLDAIDVERAAKVSGARFYYLTGPGAMLEMALVNLAMSRAVANGLVPVVPPVLVRPDAMAGTGFLGQAADDVYRLEDDDFYLVGTSEVPLAAYHSDEILPVEDLPLRYVAFSPCFRREAGSYGKDTRGIIRVHQFDKVEMFTFCDPAQAESEHERLLTWQRELLDLLDVPYRVIEVASGDLGASAARKYDIEAWVPSQQRYREVTSTSNCTTYQARRLGTRMRGESGTEPVATLNGTLVALPRTIVAILENHQQADGSVTLPEALHSFMHGHTVLSPAAGR